MKDIEEEIQRLTADELTKSKIYQLNYQNALKNQITAILYEFHSRQFLTINDYVKFCYEDGFIESLYNLHTQGIPLLLPINQIEMIRAIRLKTKLTHPIYKTLGVNVEKLKKTVTAEISRGISTGLFYRDISRNIRNRTHNLNIGRSKVIAQTEGHRVGQQASYDCLKKSVEQGADIVKQWDSSLDSKVRDTHKWLDGQIKELDEPFENYKGEKAMFPSDFGIAREDVNCRCVMLHRARWALDEEELQTLKERAQFYGLDKADSFNEFKKKYIEVIRISSPSTKSYRKSLEAIRLGKAGLSKARKSILERIPEQGTHARFDNGKISKRDLAYISAATGDELALFRSKKEDILIRGDRKACNPSLELSEEILKGGYEWVAHTHVDGGYLTPSSADKKTLRLLNQRKSIIMGVDGREEVFFKE